jgi:hypothetical protein
MKGGPMDESVIYQEEQQFYPWLIALILLACLAGIIVPLSFGAPLFKSGTWIGILVFIFLVVIFWGFRKMTVQVTPTQLIFGFPYWKVRIPLQEVMVGSKLPIPWIAGLGIHYWGGKTYFNARMSQGLEIMVGSKAYVIGTDSAEKLAKALQSAIVGGKVVEAL